MEFICVLSVSGSLVSYQVRKEEESRYSAVRTNTSKHEDVPAEIILEKGANGWQASPWHAEIVSGLTHAIEANP